MADQVPFVIEGEQMQRVLEVRLEVGGGQVTG